MLLLLSVQFQFFLKALSDEKIDIYAITFLRCEIIFKNFRIFYMEKKTTQAPVLRFLLRYPEEIF